MPLNLKWVWELTPNQVFQKNQFVKSSDDTESLPPETKGFETKKLVLPEVGLSYQVALTRKGRTEESVALRKAHPDVPDSGGYRSGVLLFTDSAIVGSLILSGANQKSLFKMVVSPKYRNQGLAEKMLVLWWSTVKHTYRTEGEQPMTSTTVKVLLNAYKAVVEKAIAEGLPVPQTVRHQLTTQAEATEVLRRAQLVDVSAK